MVRPMSGNETNSVVSCFDNGVVNSTLALADRGVRFLEMRGRREPGGLHVDIPSSI